MPNISFKPSANCDLNSELECFVNIDAEITIHVNHGGDYGGQYGVISLDISTAIMFRKHLAQKIALAKELSKEDDNG